MKRMDCEMKDSCANYDGECTNDMYCLCEDYEEMTEEQILWKTLHKTIGKLVEFDHQDLIKQIEEYESREHECWKQIAELKRQIPNIDKLRKECLQEVRKEVFGTLTVGQEIFIVKSDNNRTTCPECKGTGKLKHSLSTNEEVKVDCPKCHYGKIDNYSYTPKKATIHSIILTTWKNSDTREIVVKVEYYLGGYDYKKELKELFATVEECQAHIDSQVKQ